MPNDKRWNQIKLAAGKRVLQSGRALQFLETRILRDLDERATNRVIAAFGMDLLRKLFAEPKSRIVWTSAFFPGELLWGLGFIPFFPEIGAAVGAGIGLGEGAIARATAEAYAVDLCTFHRAAAGIAAEELFPRAGALVSTAHLCDISGQNLANHAYAIQRPLFFVDVPASQDEASIEYVEKQLEHRI